MFYTPLQIARGKQEHINFLHPELLRAVETLGSLVKKRTDILLPINSSCRTFERQQELYQNSPDGSWQFSWHLIDDGRGHECLCCAIDFGIKQLGMTADYYSRWWKESRYGYSYVNLDKQFMHCDIRNFVSRDEFRWRRILEKEINV